MTTATVEATKRQRDAFVIAESIRRGGEHNALAAVNLLTLRDGYAATEAADAVRLAYKCDKSLFLLNGLTAAQLATMELPEPKWIVPGLLPEGLTICAGKPKIGKSWLALQLGVATATGGKALEQINVEQGAVLYLDLEDSTRRIQDRLLTVLRGELAPDKLHVFTAWPRLDQGGDELLTGWLDSTPDARLLIVDPLAKVRPRRTGRRNAYDDDYDELSGLHRIANERGVAVLVVHHLRKATSDDVFDMVSGTTGTTGAADTAMVLNRQRGTGEADAELSITGRDVEDQTYALRFDGATCLWSMIGDTREVAVSRERQEIMDVLRGDELGQTPKEVANALGKDTDSERASVRYLLRRMVEAGNLEQSRNGRYALSGTVQTL